MRSSNFLYSFLVSVGLSYVGVFALPVPQSEDVLLRIQPRQNIKAPLLDISDLDLGDISPIEDGFLELDSDDGSGNDNGSTSVSNANGYLGSIGSGQSAGQENEGVEGSSAACGLLSCATSAAAANGNSTSTSSSSNGPLTQPLVNLQNNAPLIDISHSGNGTPN